MTETSLVNNNEFLDDSKFIDLIESSNIKIAELHIRRSELISNIKDSQSGILLQEMTRCGKKNCKCASGKLHGPYWYYYFWKNKKLKKKYICPVNKPIRILYELEEKIKNNRENKVLQREINRIDDTLEKIYKIKETFILRMTKTLGGI
jgi:hypothetical protein